MPFIKLFLPASEPSEDFVKSLTALSEFDPDKLKKLAEWIRSLKKPFSYTREELVSLARELNFETVMQVEDSLSLTKYILETASRKGLSFDDVSDDLKTLGFGEDAARKIETFLQELFDIGPQIVKEQTKEAYSRVNIPVAVGYSSVIDFRTVFDLKDSSQLIDIIPQAIISLNLEERSSEKETPILFQLTEQNLDDLIEKLKITAEQLKQAKTRIHLKDSNEE